MAKKDKGGKRSINPADITPEYIAEQRALREERKKKKLEDMLARGEVPESEKKESLKFITRPMISTAAAADNTNSANTFTIMTYNTLGQSLIRRKLFPENGDALKWKWRSQILQREVTHYSPSVMVCQEVDADKVPWWSEFLEKEGYCCVFDTYEGKNHGLLAAWKKDAFEYQDKQAVQYDHVELGDLPAQFKTRNTGLIVRLKHVSSGKTIVIATTHLFWHPMGSFERTKQTVMLLSATQRYVDSLDHEAVLIMAGDFNSTPWDGPYVGATEQTFDELTRPILLDSLQYKFTRKSKDEKKAEAAAAKAALAGETEPETAAEEETQANELPEEEEEGDDELEALGDVVISSEDAEKHIQTLEREFATLPLLLSLYGNYTDVHPEASKEPLTKHKKEPRFSNWAHAWRGLLDYIFVSSKNKNEIVVKGLLKMPLESDMGEEPSGQPRLDMYPSDHLAIMAEVELVN